MAASLAQVFSQVQRWTASPPAENTADTVLLERFLHQRDEAAFAALVARHGAMVLRVCRRVLGNAHDAEDAFQATFFILARKAHSLKQPAALPGWLHGVARRVALKARTKSASHPFTDMPLEDVSADARPDPLTQLTARELLDLLDEEVQRLPSAQRSAVVLCCLEGRTQEEAACILGWTPGSVKGRLERGRRRLQQRLTRRGIALPAALAIAAVSRDSAAGAVPMLLQQSAVRAALGGGIGSPAAVLAESVMNSMMAGKLAGVTALMMMLGLTLTAAIALTFREPTVEAPAAEPPKAAEAPAQVPRGDALGDPLPEGAIARLGTVRFRHGGDIDAIVFTPDGKRLISKGTDGVRVWDAATGKELRHLAPSAGELWHGADLSPDGARLAVIHGPASSIDLWDVHRGEIMASLGHGDYSMACLSPDGKRLAVCSKMSGIELWDVAGQQPLQAWKAHQWQVWSLAFTADSRRLVSSGTEGKIRFWDAATGRQVQELTYFNSRPESLPFPNGIRLAPDGKTLAIIERSEKQTPQAGPAQWQACISIWDTTRGKRVRQLSCPTKERWPNYAPPFGALTFTADSKQLLTSGPDHLIRIWDPATGEELRRIPFDPQPSSYLSLSSDGKTLAAVGGRRTAIQLLDLISGKAHTPPEGYPVNVSNPWFALLTPDGRTAITGSREDALLIWDVAAGRVRQRLQGYDNVMSLRLSPDGRTLISHDSGNTLHVRQLDRGEEGRSLKLDFACGREMVVTPEGRSVVVVDTKGIVHLIDVVTGKERIHFQGPEFLWGLASTPDGRSLVGWSGDRKVRVWDVTNGRQRQEWPVPEDIRGKLTLMAGGNKQGSGYSAALSPDGRLLAMGSLVGPPISGTKHEYPLVFKELIGGQDIRRGDPLPWDPDRLAFSPDGRLLAWCSFFRDPSIHLLEVASGRERRRLIGHRGRVSTLHFSANGERLISGSDDTTALVWDLHGRYEPRQALSAVKLEELWADLAAADAARAYQAIRTLTAAPNSVVPFLRQRLRPVLPVDEKRVARLIADLDSNDFAIRQKAITALEKLGDQPILVYRKVLAGQPPLETRRRLEELLEKAAPAWWNMSGERLRLLRAIEVLEWAGTKEAREVLEALAAGVGGAWLTEEAKAAVERLAKR